MISPKNENLVIIHPVPTERQVWISGQHSPEQLPEVDGDFFFKA